MADDEASPKTNKEELTLLFAEENPWYVLATIHGEVESSKPWSDLSQAEKDIVLRNRRAWNGFMCQSLTDDQRNEIKKIKTLSAELQGLTGNQEQKIREKFRKRFPDLDKNQAYKMFNNMKTLEEIDLSAITVEKPIYMTRFIFGRRVLFYCSEFEEFVNFEESYFEGAVFYDSVFSNDVNLKGSVFNKSFAFVNTKFNRNANFEYVEFRDGCLCSNTIFNADGASSEICKIGANFYNCKFFGYAYFKFSKFYEISNFDSAKFHSLAIFHKVEFKDQTSFTDAKFKLYPPEFYDAKLYKDTIFTLDGRKWPVKMPISDVKNTYAHLRYLMHEQLRPDEEHFFYRREMAWKARHERPLWQRPIISLYGCFSGYGHSILRPLIAFLITLISTPIFVWLGNPLKWANIFISNWLEEVEIPFLGGNLSNYEYLMKMLLAFIVGALLFTTIFRWVALIIASLFVWTGFFSSDQSGKIQSLHFPPTPLKRKWLKLILFGIERVSRWSISGLLGMLYLPVIFSQLMESLESGWPEKIWPLPTDKLPCLQKGDAVFWVLRVSAANMFPLFGFRRKYVFCKFESEPWGWLLVGGLQSLLAIAFLFLFALALRNRFRLR